MLSNNGLVQPKDSEALDEIDYYANQDPEEENIVHIEKEVSQRYKNLEKLYEQIVPPDYYPTAKVKSQSEQVRLKLTKDKAFTYGEMTFRTMSYIFEVIRKTFGEKSIKPGNFFDLGSGHGNVCAQVAFIHPFDKITGIEYLSPLHKMAIQTKIRYENKFSQILSDHNHLFPYHNKAVPEIEYIKGDFFDTDWTKASVLFCNSTCFSDDVVKRIYEKAVELPSGSFYVTVCNYMPEELMINWEIIPPFSRMMSWGTAEVLVFRRK